MSIWTLLFPGNEAKELRLREEAELTQLSHDRSATLRAAESASKSSSRLMQTYAESLEFMERRRNEDR